MEYRSYARKLVNYYGSVRAAARVCNIPYASFHRIYAGKVIKPSQANINSLLLTCNKLKGEIK